jgi:hypothetical protein
MSDEIGPSTTLKLRRRLQRPPDFTGDSLDSFQQVFIRHGLPGAVLGMLCLLHPDLRELLSKATASAANSLSTYVICGILILAALNIYTLFTRRRWSTQTLGWACYLGLLSLWEEWLFRIALPYGLESLGSPLIAGVVLSNILFGLLHYFTLRWKWQWCVAACIGGFAFSRQMDMHFDLLLVAGIHWIATFLNTPTPPAKRSDVS